MNVIDFNKKYDYNFTSHGSYMVGDIESSLDENNNWNFELIVISDGFDIYEFNDIDECIEWLLEEEDSKDIWFHNLDFDMLFFFKTEMFKRLEDIKLIASGNMNLSFKIGNITFKNSLALFPMSLKNVVKKFLKVTDKDWESDKSNVLELKNEELVKYCTLDVLYLSEALNKFMTYFKKTFDMDTSLTVPATALKVWKKHFLDDKSFIDLCKRNKFFDSNYYFGGHTEKFVDDKNVFRNVNYYDVNSLYPSVMVDIEFPNSKLRRTSPTLTNLKRLLKRKELFYFEIVLNIDSEALRHFPVLDEKNKVNMYPFGEHVIKGSEFALEFILEFGCWDNIKKIKTLLIGEDETRYRPFKKYVETFYAKRKSDPSNDVIFKLLLNGLYGKFGQKIVREEKIINDTKTEANPKRVVKSEIGYVSTYDVEVPYYQLDTFRLDVAGKITETARLKMGRYINYINKEFGKGSVIYMDTDSIITYADLTTSSVMKNFLDDVKLGMLGDEIGYQDNMICLGQKMYHFYKSGKKATKGVKNMGLDEFRGVLRGHNKFVNKRFSRMGAFINKGVHGIQYVPYELKNIRGRLDH
jgi:hypothetical protein